MQFNTLGIFNRAGVILRNENWDRLILISFLLTSTACVCGCMVNGVSTIAAARVCYYLSHSLKDLSGTNLKFVYGILLCFLLIEGSKPIRLYMGSNKLILGM